MGRANLVALLHALSGAGAMIASLYTKSDFLASVRVIKPLGFDPWRWNAAVRCRDGLPQEGIPRQR